MSTCRVPKVSKPKTLTAIFDGIRSANCDLCGVFEDSDLPQQIAKAAKEVESAREVVHYQHRQGMPEQIKEAQQALRLAERRQTRLHKRLQKLMFEANGKLLLVMTAFGELSMAATTGKFSPEEET
jgi:hypothetical protein